MTHHHNWFRTFPLIMLLYNNASSARIEFSILRVVIHFNFQKQNYFRDITRDELNRPTDTRSVKYDNNIIIIM